MTSWDRRVAAATRQRDNTDPEFIDERLRALGLPETIHPDDKVAVLTLLRVADARANNFGATVLGRVAEGDGSIRTIRIVVLGNDNGATILVGDGDPELKLELDRLTGLPGRTYLLLSLIHI